MITIMENRRVNEAKILQMSAHARVLEAQADSEPAKRSVEAFRAAIEALREQNNRDNANADRMLEAMNSGTETGFRGDDGAGSRIPSLEKPGANTDLFPVA